MQKSVLRFWPSRSSLKAERLLSSGDVAYAMLAVLEFWDEECASDGTYVEE